MALAIKAIPTLYGEEARRFQEMADETERKYDISPKRDIKKDPRYRAMRTILERSNIKILQVVPERAEGPKALSPGQRPGYTRSQPCALQGQKLYITLYHRQPFINTLRD